MTIQPRTLRQWALAVTALSIVVVSIRYVHATAPTQPADGPIIELADPSAEVVTCVRTIPARQDIPDPAEVVPIGRVQSAEVYECPEAFDRQVVVYVGEVVGDVLRRRGGAWVLMNDDAYALEVGPLAAHRQYAGANSGLSVWLPDELADLVGRAGGSGWHGDVLRVRGVIHRVDPADGGGLTLRAFAGSVVAEATPVEPPVNRPQAALAGALVMLLAALAVRTRRAAASR